MQEPLKLKFYNDSFHLIGKGTSRWVYDTNDNNVIKIAKTMQGVWQNESECRLFEKYKNLDLLLPIENIDKDHLWVVQKKAQPLNDLNIDIFTKYSGIRFSDFAKTIEIANKYSREKLPYDVYLNFNSDYLNKFKEFILSEQFEFLSDFAKPDSWGILNGKLYIIDYGMDNETFAKYMKRK